MTLGAMEEQGAFQYEHHVNSLGWMHHATIIDLQRCWFSSGNLSLSVQHVSFNTLLHASTLQPNPSPHSPPESF
jgi:hypothetical protein